MQRYQPRLLRGGACRMMSKDRLICIRPLTYLAQKRGFIAAVQPPLLVLTRTFSFNQKKVFENHGSFFFSYSLVAGSYTT